MGRYVGGAMVFAQESLKRFFEDHGEKTLAEGAEKKGTLIFTGTLGALRCNVSLLRSIRGPENILNKTLMSSSGTSRLSSDHTEHHEGASDSWRKPSREKCRPKAYMSFTLLPMVGSPMRIMKRRRVASTSLRRLLDRRICGSLNSIRLFGHMNWILDQRRRSFSPGKTAHRY
jgi:hypothetical protein